MRAHWHCLLTLLPQVFAAPASQGLILLQKGVEPKPARHHRPRVGHQRPSRQLSRDAIAQTPAAPASPVPVGMTPSAPQALAPPAAVVNNLGGLGPDYGMPPVITLGSVFKADGTMVDVIVTNLSSYVCGEADTNSITFGTGGWENAVISVTGDSAVQLNISFVNHLTGAPTALERFALTVLDVDESTTSGLREVVIAQPDSFAVNPTTSMAISKTPSGDIVFAGRGGHDGKYPPSPYNLIPEAQDCAVLFEYFNRESIVLTLQVTQTNPLLKTAIKKGHMGGRNFWFVGDSQLKLTGVTMNTTLLNASGQIASGSGLGVGMAPQPVIAKMPSAPNSSDVGVAMNPTGIPPIQTQTAANGTISTTPLVIPAAVLAPAPSSPVAVRGPTGIPVAVAAAFSPTPDPVISADAFVTSAPILVPGATTVPPPKKNTPSFICGSDNSDQAGFCPECTMSQMCQCNGWVRFGYEPMWTAWQQVNGVVDCNASEFGDVYPGHGKICVCAEPVASEGYWTGPTLAGMWWPVVAVVTPAVLLIAASTIGSLVGRARSQKSLVEVALEATVPCVGFAPMIVALFVAAAKRGEYVLAGGAGAESLLQLAARGSPDLSTFHEMDVCIKVCAVAFVCQVVSRALYEFLAARERARGPAISFARESQGDVWLLCHHVSVLVTYLSLAALLALLMTMGSLPFVAATLCTIILAVVYFGCYLVLHILTFSRSSDWFKALAKLSVLNMQFAPMLSVLFIGMQVAAEAATGGPVKPYVEDWMKICTASNLLQVVLSTLMPILFRATLETSQDNKEDLVLHQSQGVVLFSGIRWATMAVMYLGAWKICRALWLTDVVQGRAHALCLFAAVYFVAFAALWIVMTLRQLSDRNSWQSYSQAVQNCSTATQIVAVCPMAAAFLVGWWVVAAP